MEEVALGWLGWSEEQTLYSDVNAIIIGFRGCLRKMQAYNGHDPFADSSTVPINNSNKSTGKASRIAPDPRSLPALTPEAFDIMFPGKK